MREAKILYNKILLLIVPVGIEISLRESFPRLFHRLLIVPVGIEIFVFFESL